MGENPDTIRQQIEETRSEMGDTVEALGYKADVKARAKENVQEKVDSVTGAVSSVKDKVVGQGSGAKDQLGQTIGGAKTSIGDGAHAAQYRARKAADVAQQNPLGLAIGAAAVGFLGGLLIPTTELEDEKVGPMADQIKDRARDAGQELIDRGSAVASDAMDTAKQAAKDVAQDVREAAPAA